MNQSQVKKIAVIDIDGTLIRGQVQQGLINHFYSRHQIGTIFMLRLNGWFIMYKLGFVKNLKSIFEFALSFLAGRSTSVVDSLVDEYIQSTVKSRIFPKSFDLINSLKKDGYSIILLSTAIDILVSRIANLFKVDDYICTRLESKDGIYTGQLLGSIVYGNEKMNTLKKYFEARSYSLADAVAYADHESDIPMMKVVGKAYMVNPTTRTAQLAQKEGIAIMETR